MSADVHLPERRGPSPLLLGALAALFLLMIGSLAWSSRLSRRLEETQKKLNLVDQKNDQLSGEQLALSDRLKATTETLGQSVGMTQKQIETRAQSLVASQAAATQAAKLQADKLERAQQAASAQMTAVATDVSSVKSDVGTEKASLVATESALAETNAQLQRTIGDAGVMSGLIARNHDDLETLKRRGDRNYFEFTLQKGGRPTPLGNLRLQLKKTDEKHSKYTMMLLIDDHLIEKKDKGLDEPVQFYTGKDSALDELVVNTIARNTVAGYLSVPKNPKP